MLKLASAALTAVIGVAGLATSTPAAADPVVRVGYGYAPFGYGPYVRYWHGRYCHYRPERWRHHWERW